MEAATAERPATAEPMNIALRMDEAMRDRLRKSEGVVAIAEATVIDCAPMADAAKADLDDVIRRQKVVIEERDGFVADAVRIIDRAKALFNPGLAALKSAEGIYRTKLTVWTKSEKERVAAENRAREEAARKARAEAEQKAAADRARAEEVERKARQEAALAEEAKLKAQREAEEARKRGDKEAAAKAEREAKARAAEQAKKEEQERNAKAEGERKALEARLEADAAARNAPQAEVAAAPQGFSVRSVWVAALADGKTEDDAKIAIAKAIAEGRTDFLPIFKLDLGAAGKLAKAQKAHFNVPGLKAVEETTSVNRGGK